MGKMNQTVDPGLIDIVADGIPYYLYEYEHILKEYPQVINFGLFLGISIGIVIFASFTTLSKPRTAKDPIHDRLSPCYDLSDRDESDYLVMNSLPLKFLNKQQLSFKMALVYPFIGGSVLYGLYYCMNNYDTNQLSKVLNWYVLLMSPVVYYNNLYYGMTFALRKLGFWLKLPNNSGWFFPRYRLSLSTEQDFPLGVLEEVNCVKLNENDYNDEKWFKKFKVFNKFENGIKILKPTNVLKDHQLFNLVFDLKMMVLLPVTGLLSTLFHQYNPIFNEGYSKQSTNWLVIDLVGINFAIFGIKNFKIDSTKTSLLLLIGLFIYDIYFVFGTELMESVATGLDIPIKILLPSNNGKFNLLGLGDIVLPGSFISLLLRLDLYNHYQKQEKRISFHHLNHFDKPYFIAGIVSYLLGLSICMGVLLLFNRGQPALLYIVPSLLVGTAVTALRQQEFKKVWQFNEIMKEFEEQPRSLKQVEEEEENDDDYVESESDDDDFEYEDDTEDDLQNLIDDQLSEPQVIYEFGDSEDDTCVIDSEIDL